MAAARPLSADTLDLVARHLPDEPKPHKTIYESGERLWSPLTWRNALNRLVEIGVAERSTEPNGYGDNIRHLYRRAI